jgi:hypothetical protein
MLTAQPTDPPNKQKILDANDDVLKAGYGADMMQCNANNKGLRRMFTDKQQRS